MQLENVSTADRSSIKFLILQLNRASGAIRDILESIHLAILQIKKEHVDIKFIAHARRFTTQ